MYTKHDFKRGDIKLSKGKSNEEEVSLNERMMVKTILLILSVFTCTHLFANTLLPDVKGEVPEGVKPEQMFVLGSKIIRGIDGKANVQSGRDTLQNYYEELKGIRTSEMMGTSYLIDQAIFNNIGSKLKMLCDIVGARVKGLEIFKVYSISNCEEVGINKMARLINEKYED